MVLMSSFGHHSLLRDIQSGLFALRLGSIARNPPKILFDKTHQLFKTYVPYRADDHPLRLIITAHERQYLIPVEMPHRLFRSQYIPADRFVFIDQFFKIIKNQFSRTIFIRIDFINHHILFFFNLSCRKN